MHEGVPTLPDKRSTVGGRLPSRGCRAPLCRVAMWAGTTTTPAADLGSESALSVNVPYAARLTTLATLSTVEAYRVAARGPPPQAAQAQTPSGPAGDGSGR
jgi:hypothetical protein